VVPPEVIDGIQFGHQARRGMLGDKSREVGQREDDLDESVRGKRRCNAPALDDDLVPTFVPRGSASCDLATEKNRRRPILLSLVVGL
jgi:hypothetical protein